MQALRRAIPPEERARLAGLIGTRLLRLPQILQASTILVFASFGSETPTEGIIRSLRTGPDGEPRRILLPFLRGDRMEVAEHLPDGGLLPSSYGPPEPARPQAANPLEVDLAVAPGLAFDSAGYRLGYGGGHYDRFLAAMRPEAARVGICFHAQLVRRVPREGSDVPMDVVVTERETIVSGGR